MENTFDKNLGVEQKYQPKPFDYRFEKETFSVSIIERHDGSVDVILKTADGHSFNLQSLVPEGVEIVGNVKTWNDPKYTGLHNCDTSLFDDYNKSIILSHEEMTRLGARYVVVVLHEIGHALSFINKPNDWKMMQDTYSKASRESQNEELQIQAQALNATEELNAWRYAFKQLSAILDDLHIESDALFDNEEEIKAFINDFMLMKVDSAEQVLCRSGISEKRQKELVSDIFDLYIQ